MSPTSPTSPRPPSRPNTSFQNSVYEVTSKQYVRLLKAVDSCGWNLYSGAALQRAIWRYETMWLPLASAVAIENLRNTAGSLDGFSSPQIHYCGLVQKVRDILPQGERSDSFDMVPPLDVAWVWYLHRLSGDIYVDDVYQSTGVSLAPNHTAAFKFGTSNRAQGAFLWNKLFKRADAKDNSLSYFPKYLSSLIDESGKVLKRKAAFGSLRSVPFTSHLTYNIAYAAECHRGVLKAYLHNKAAVENYNELALDRYRQYLQNIVQLEDRTFLPPADIDIMWRIHAGCTAEYMDDDLVKTILNYPGQNELGKSAHPQALNIYKGRKQKSVLLDEMELQEVSRTWRERHESTIGSYVLPNTIAIMKPLGARDGFAKDTISTYLNHLDNNDRDSSHSSSSSSAILTESESGSGSNSASSSVSNSTSSSDSEMFNGNNLIPLKTFDYGDSESGTLGSSTFRSQFKSQERSCINAASASERDAHLKSYEKNWNEMNENFSAGTRLQLNDNNSFFSKKGTSHSNHTFNTRTHGRLQGDEGNDGKVAFHSHPQGKQTVLVVSLRKPEHSSDDSSDSVRVMPRKRKKEMKQKIVTRRMRKKEMRRRLREHKEYEKEALRHAQHAHGLSGGRAEIFSRVQIARGFILCLLAFVLMITGIVCMAGLDNMGNTGDFLFMAGMVSFLLGSMALTRQDANVRAEKREQARQRREQRKANASDVKAEKESKDSFTAGIRIYTFNATEAGIFLGGGDHGMTTGGSASEWIECGPSQV